MSSVQRHTSDGRGQISDKGAKENSEPFSYTHSSKYPTRSSAVNIRHNPIQPRNDVVEIAGCSPVPFDLVIEATHL